MDVAKVMDRLGAEVKELPQPICTSRCEGDRVLQVELKVDTLVDSEPSRQIPLVPAR